MERESIKQQPKSSFQGSSLEQQRDLEEKGWKNEQKPDPKTDQRVKTGCGCA